ncbi:MAG: hypothetical protein P8I99_15300 [Acidimicrobiales bacterium]|nr:hypothetical protein [Acidimicrobiales bacterium]MDG1878772.1 hypothetical protein [Acidimicrobiales bacterium]
MLFGIIASPGSVEFSEAGDRIETGGARVEVADVVSLCAHILVPFRPDTATCEDRA